MITKLAHMWSLSLTFHRNFWQIVVISQLDKETVGSSVKMLEAETVIVLGFQGIQQFTGKNHLWIIHLKYTF